MALTAKKVYALLKRQISDMEAKLNHPVRYKGTVASAELLPLNPDIGDMYNIETKSIYGEAGMNVAWNGVTWDTMGAPIDMSLYLKSTDVPEWAKQSTKPTYTAEEIGALPDDTKIPSKISDLKNDSEFLTTVPLSTEDSLGGIKASVKTANETVEAKIDPETGKVYVPELPGSENLSKEETAQKILAKFQEIIPLIEQIVSNGTSSSVNGFSFIHGDDGSVTMTYTPDGSSEADMALLPTGTTQEKISQAMKEIVASLKIIAGKDETA